MRIKYCLPIIKSNFEEIEKITGKNIDYDYFEIWLDYIKDLKIEYVEKLSKKLKDKVIVLFRRKNLEKIKMDESLRYQIIDLIKDSKSLLDLDISNQKKELSYINNHQIKLSLIVSYHNYKKTPDNEELDEIIEEMKKYQTLIYKISTFCQTEEDCLRLMDLLIKLKRENLKFIVLGMGEKGRKSRIFTPALGNQMNFAPVSLKEKSAPGQLTKNQLDKLVNKVEYCLFIADPVEHSLSPKMHNSAYRVLGLEDKFLYLRRRVKPEELVDTIKELRNDSFFKGASISIPHKIEVIKYLDKVDQVAKKIGAVNTVVKSNQKLTGYNTDWLGILNPLQKISATFKGKTAAVIGAGGAARSALYTLNYLGIKPTVFARDLKKADNLAKDFDCELESLKNLDKITKFDIVIHATKVGMNIGDKSIISKDQIIPNQIIFDVVYLKNGKKTELIKIAREKKARTIEGIEMLLYQGIAQFELFTNQKAPVDVMRKALI